MHIFLRIFLLLLAVAGLIGVRYMEEELFYDPFLHYFKEHNLASIPNFEIGSIIRNHIFRFLLNLLFSLLLIYALFKSLKFVKIGASVILLFFIPCFFIYMYLIINNMPLGESITFYMRRFVIQPILLLVLVPSFYYLKNIRK